MGENSLWRRDVWVGDVGRWKRLQMDMRCVELLMEMERSEKGGMEWISPSVGLRHEMCREKGKIIEIMISRKS